jgi:uncharacterized membrane protein
VFTPPGYLNVSQHACVKAGWTDKRGGGMSNIIPRLKRQILGVIPNVVFFFIVFQLLAFTRTLILKGYGIQASTFLKAAIAALIVGKVVLLTDLLPMINRFPNKPLIYNIVWKTFIYMVAAILVRYVEHLIPLIREYKNLTVANNHFLDEVIWPHFWLVQFWLLVCFLIFNAMRELGRILGRDQLRSMFFGPGFSDVV